MTANLACMVRHQRTLVHPCDCVGLFHVTGNVGVQLQILAQCPFHRYWSLAKARPHRRVMFAGRN